MPLTEDERELAAQTAQQVIAFRVPSSLADAVGTAAAQDMCSKSDVGRKALLQHLRERGLFVEAV